ncbi:hypothetical protein [Dolosicoccus paucivorans]
MKKKLLVLLFLLLCFPLNALAEDNKDKFIHTLSSGVDTYTLDNYDNFTDNMIVKGMIMESRNHLKDNLEQFKDKDVIYRGFHKMTDKYGNDKEVFSYVLFVSKDEIAKINAENWNPTNEDMINLSDGFYLHPAFSKSKFYSMQKTDKELPGFNGVINGTYVNDGTMGMDPSKQKEAPSSTDAKDIDTPGGPLNPEGKRMLNENLYEEIIDGNKIQYAIFTDDIFSASILFEDARPELSFDDEYLISLIKKHTHDDIYFVSDESEDGLIQYVYHSDELDRDYAVEFGAEDDQTIYGIFIIEKTD